MELAESLGNVSEACRRLGLTRHFYYAGLRRRETADAGAGQARKRHPSALSPALAAEILILIRQYPEWGCVRIAYYLELNGKPVSSPTVQKFLIRNGLGRIPQRMDYARAALPGHERARKAKRIAAPRDEA